MSNKIVTVKNLSHRYSLQWAVKDVSFDITDKGVVGLLGSNGAGKSTTMNIICGVLNQSEGDVFIDGINLREDAIGAKKCIGFLPQNPPVYTDLTVEEYLRHCADLRLMPKNEINTAVEVAMQKCSITHFRNRLIKNLSGGYQQRVGIAQAIVHNPKFVVLDEPTNGLDPNQIVDIRNLIRDIAKHHAVLLSTHILSEVQALCDEINMIEGGRLVFSGTMEEFDNYITPVSFIVEFGAVPALDKIKEACSCQKVEEIGHNRYRIFFEGDITVTEKLINESVACGWDLKELVVERCSLEEIFAQLSGKQKLKQKYKQEEKND